jgi:LysM repeat protein
MGLRLRVLALAVVLVGVCVVALPTATASASGPGVHCVKYGETLWSIARYHGTSAYTLAHYNGLQNPNYVRAGWCLKIPAHSYHGGYKYYGGHGYQGGHKYQGGVYYKPGRCDQYPACCTAKPPAYCHGWHGSYGKPPAYHYGGWTHGRYCVKYGDTLWSIARRFGTSAYAIASANGLANPNYIRAGQCLVIP